MTEESRTQDEYTEEEHLEKFFKEFVTVDRAMEPLKEHLIALKANYVENKWLSRDQMSMVLKGYRAAKDDLDLEQLGEMMDMVKKQLLKL